MAKSITKKDVHEVYAIMSRSRLNDLKSNDDKTAVLKVLREFRFVAKNYEEDAKETAEKLMPDGYAESLQQAQQYERRRAQGKTDAADGMTSEEYNEFISAHVDYQQQVAKAMADVDQVTVELDFEPISSDVLTELMNTNGWTVEQYFKIEEVLSI